MRVDGIIFGGINMKYKNQLITGIIMIVCITIGVIAGIKYERKIKSRGTNVVYLAKINSFDGKVLKYTYENGSTRTIKDISEIKVWKGTKNPKRVDKSYLKPNIQVKIAADQLTEKVYAILITDQQ